MRLAGGLSCLIPTGPSEEGGGRSGAHVVRGAEPESFSGSRQVGGVCQEGVARAQRWECE